PASIASIYASSRHRARPRTVTLCREAMSASLVRTSPGRIRRSVRPCTAAFRGRWTRRPSVPDNITFRWWFTLATGRLGRSRARRFFLRRREGNAESLEAVTEFLQDIAERFLAERLQRRTQVVAPAPDGTPVIPACQM